MAAPKIKWPKPDAAYTVPLYGGEVYLFKTISKLQSASRFLSSAADIDFSGLLGCVTYYTRNSNGNRIYCVGVFDNSLTTLVHECSHVALSISETVGIKPTESCGEPFCYLIDNIFDVLSKPFKPTIKVKPKKPVKKLPPIELVYPDLLKGATDTYED